MKWNCLVLGVSLAMPLTFALPAPAQPANRPAQPARNNNNNRNAAAERQAAIAKARKDLTEAQAGLPKVELTLRQTTVELKKEYETSPEWTAAHAALKQAQADYDAARAQVIDRMKTNADYSAAREKKAKAEAAREALGDSARGSQEYINASTAVMMAGSDITKLEEGAVAADPKASEAKSRLTAAHAKVQELENKHTEAVKSNPKWQTANKAVEDAKAKVAAAQSELDKALQAQAAANPRRQQPKPPRTR